MTDNYYYFVAGLPELTLDDGKKAIQCLEFAQEVQEHLSAADYADFRYLLYPFDNHNLVSLAEKKGLPFDKRGFYSEEELAAGLKTAEGLPDYMLQYIDMVRENRLPAAGLTGTDMLWSFFYDAMSRHPLPFMNSWYTYDRTLRNLTAAINCQKDIEHLANLSSERDKSLESVIIGDDEASESIRRSNAPDFGLSSIFPEVETVITLSKGPLIDFDKGLDNLRWSALNDITESYYFRAEMIFAFYIKLTIVERWHTLDPKTGQAHLDKLIRELKGSYTVPATY